MTTEQKELRAAVVDSEATVELRATAIDSDTTMEEALRATAIHSGPKTVEEELRATEES